MDFKSKYPFTERKNEALRVLEKYPGRLPIVCERHSKSKTAPEIDKNKYLLPDDLTMGQFIYVIRKRLQIDPNLGLYFFINGVIPPTSQYMRIIYNSYHENDGFLYIKYATENTFG